MDQEGKVPLQAKQIPIGLIKTQDNYKVKSQTNKRNDARTCGILSHDRGTIAPPRPGRHGTSLVFLQFLHTKNT